MAATDADTATYDASPNIINTAPRASNAATASEYAASTAENKMSMRQLLYGQEYTVAKGDIIKKGSDYKASVEKCVAYIHVFA